MRLTCYKEQKSENDTSNYFIREEFRIDTENPIASHESEKSLLQNSLLFVKNPVVFKLDTSANKTVALKPVQRINVAAFWIENVPILHQIPQFTGILLALPAKSFWQDSVSIDTPTGKGIYVSSYTRNGSSVNVEGYYIPPVLRQADVVQNKQEYVMNTDLLRHDYSGTLHITPNGLIRDLEIVVSMEEELSNSISKFRQKSNRKFIWKMSNKIVDR